MTKTKLTATLPNGEIATRTTARTYTHVVAAYTPAARRVAALREAADHRRKLARRYDEQASVIEAHGISHESAEDPSDVRGTAAWTPLADLPVEFTRLDGSRNAARTTIVWHPATYRRWAADAIAAAERDELEADRVEAADEDGPMGVAGWCGRLDLAEKLATRTENFGDVCQIVPVDALEGDDEPAAPAEALEPATVPAADHGIGDVRAVLDAADAANQPHLGMFSIEGARRVACLVLDLRAAGVTSREGETVPLAVTAGLEAIADDPRDTRFPEATDTAVREAVCAALRPVETLADLEDRLDAEARECPDCHQPHGVWHRGDAECSASSAALSSEALGLAIEALHRDADRIMARIERGDGDELRAVFVAEAERRTAAAVEIATLLGGRS